MSCRSLVLVVLNLNEPREWLIMQSVYITTDVLISNLDQGEVYNIM